MADEDRGRHRRNITSLGTDQHPDVARLRDPLTDVTRKERRLLLGVSMIGITIVTTGLLPKQIQALGITLEPKDQASLLLLLAAVVAYFWVAFAIYAIVDFSRWFLEIQLAQDWEGVTHRAIAAQWTSGIRSAFDFSFPLLLGATSIITLVRGSGAIFIGDEVRRGLSLTAQVLTVLVTLPVVLYLARTWVEYLMLPIGRIVPFRKIAVQLNDADAHALFDFLNGPLEKFVFRSRANGVCQFTPFVAH